MSESRLRTIVRKEVDKYIHFPTNEEPSVKGGCSSINFTPPTDFALCHEIKFAEKKSAPLELAYSKLNRKELQSLPDQGPVLLQRKKVTMDFILNHLWNNENGQKVSIRALCDLWDFSKNIYSVDQGKETEGAKIDLKKIYLKPKQFVEILAQILLAVNDLHSKFIVHRDLKRENFFIYEFEGDYFVRLADLDSLLDVDKLGRYLPIKGVKSIHKPISPGYMAPESDDDFESCNLLKVDCFAIGKVILFMDTMGFPQYERHLSKLISSLIRKNPKKRCTINEALENPLFGVNTDARAAFFQRIREKNKKLQYLIDDEKVSTVRVGNPYWVLPTQIKSIYKPIIVLAEKIQENLEQLQYPENFSSLVSANQFFHDAEKDKPSMDIFALYPNKEYLSAYQADIKEAALVPPALFFQKALEEIIQEYKNELTDSTFSSCCLFKKTIKNPIMIKLENILKALTSTSEANQYNLLQEFLNVETTGIEKAIHNSLIEKILKIPLEKRPTHLVLPEIASLSHVK